MINVCEAELTRCSVVQKIKGQGVGISKQRVDGSLRISRYLSMYDWDIMKKNVSHPKKSNCKLYKFILLSTRGDILRYKIKLCTM